MHEDFAPGSEAAEAPSSELAQELERIDGEKVRLRLLAQRLGLSPAATPPVPRAHPEPQPSTGALDRRSQPAPEERPERRHVRRPSLPPSSEPDVSAPPRALEAPALERPRAPALLEALTGFVPAALYDEMKRERDELFFRLAKLEMERSHVESVRRSLDAVEAEVRRLEEEVRRRRAADGGGVEPLRLAYRRWLRLRQRRALRFGDYLACRRCEREEP